MIGSQRMESEFPGAFGAQLIGKLIHPPHPNPHESQSARFLAIVSISCSACGENPIEAIFPDRSTLALRSGDRLSEL